MTERPNISLMAYFAPLTDPRVERSRHHKLIDIIVIGICAVLCGADGWADMERFGKAKYEWLKGFLELPYGIPSHDTFGRVFAQLCPRAFEAAFVGWMQAVAESLSGQVVAIDGKTVRRSYDRRSSKAAVHMVSAWAHAQHLVLGQVRTDAKSNEITAIPELLGLLNLHGCIVTIDAMGCQKSIAAEIIERGADYVLALKGNHDHLHHDVRLTFEALRRSDFNNTPYSYHETLDKDHGRIEVRRYWSIPVPEWMAEEYHAWTGLRSLGLVESQRHMEGQVSTETRCYLCSLPADAQRLAHAVRGHWGVENPLHWVLDVVFAEDNSRVRKDHAPGNLSLLRRIALNLLRRDTSTKAGVNAKRLKAGWDERYLTNLLTSNYL